MQHILLFFFIFTVSKIAIHDRCLHHTFFTLQNFLDFQTVGLLGLDEAHVVDAAGDVAFFAHKFHVDVLFALEQM